MSGQFKDIADPSTPSTSVPIDETLPGNKGKEELQTDFGITKDEAGGDKSNGSELDGAGKENGKGDINAEDGKTEPETEEKGENGVEIDEISQAKSEAADKNGNDKKVEDTIDTKSDRNSKKDSHIHKDKSKTHYQRPQNNSKFDPTVEPVTDDAGLIRRQVDFYFSDSNLPTDKYLWELTDGATNLPVKISKIHSFKRMRRFQPYSAVVAALRDSITLDVTGPEGSEEVKRKIPYDPNKKDLREPRTVYVKGFGEELPTTQFDIEAFFAQYGPTNSVRLRRTDDKLFKGSCFIEFQDEETALSFLALDPKPLWQGKAELKIMSMKDYKAEKTQMIKDGLKEPNESRTGFFRGRGSWGHRGDHQRGDRDPDNWKKRREDDRKSGFRDNRRDRGRGGRNRGRGNDKDGRNNDRNQERDDKYRAKSENDSANANVDAAQGAGVKIDNEETSKKRARVDDSQVDDQPLKKLDQKEASTADAS